MIIRAFGRTIYTGKDLAQYAGRADDMFAVIQNRYGVDLTSRNLLKAYKGIVYDCVSLIGEAVAEYEPIIQQKKGDRWEAIEHEFLELLRNPTGENLEGKESFSQFDLFEGTGIYQLLQGDCFWYLALTKNSKRPREIVVLRPDRVGTDVDDNGKINGYYLRQDGGNPIPLEVNEVLRFNFFNPRDPYKGYGPTIANADYIETDDSTSKFTKNFFKNGGGIPGILGVKGEVSNNAFKKFVRNWRDKYEGVDAAGRIAIIRNSEASYTKVGLGLDELNMESLRKMSIKDVLRAFKVPLPLLGEAEQTGLGRANVEALEYIFAKYNIDKKMKRFDAVLEFALKRYYPELKNVRVTHENIIPLDKDYQLNYRDKAVDRWLTRDEIREEEGLDSVEGADQLFLPMTSVPVNEASLNTSEPQAEQKALITVKRAAKKKVLKISSEKAERFRLSLMRNQRKYERQYKKKVLPIFRQQRKEALTNLEAHAGSLKKDGQQKLFDDAAYDALMVEELTPMLTDLTRTQGALALVFAGDDDNEFHLTSNIISKLQRGTQRMASRFNDDTIERLNKTLAVGVQNGEGLHDLKKRVNEVYDNVESYRTERIARTETLKASNAATLDAYRQTGYVKGKIWIVNPNACPECGEFDGKRVPLDDAFLSIGESYTFTDEEGNEQTKTNDYDTVETPPLHPNCRCTIIPEI